MEGYEGGGREDISLEFLEGVCERAKERRESFFGSHKTTRAMAAEAVLVAYAPALILELKKLRQPTKRKRGV